MSETQQTVRVAMRLATILLGAVMICATSCGVNRDYQKAVLLKNNVSAPAVACAYGAAGNYDHTLCVLQAK